MSLLATEPTFAPASVSELSDLVRDIEEAIRVGASSEDIGRLRSRGVQLIADHPRSRKDAPSVAAACQVIELCLGAGWLDRPASMILVGEAAKAIGQGWTGLLTALLLAPAWQIADLPEFEAAPLFLWRTLALAIFRLPFAVIELGQAQAMARLRLARLRELARMAEFNPGATALREAAQVAIASADLRPLHTTTVPLHEALLCRSRIRAALNRRTAAFVMPALLRSGRRLKLGVVLENLVNDRRWRAILPWFESLDAQRFEPVVFFSGKSDATAESYLDLRAIPYRRLLGETAEQNLQLQAQALDLVLVSQGTPGTNNSLTDLFVERVAPVQASCDEFGFTSGLSAFDVALLATAASPTPAVYSERLLTAPLAGDRALPGELKGTLRQTWTRADLGFAPDSVIYASVAPFALLSPEWADRAARLLAEQPAARLLVYSGAPEDAGAAGMSRICAVLEPALLRHQVDAARLLISNEALGNWADLEGLLQLADFHLDSFPLADPDGQLLARGAGLVAAGAQPGSRREFQDPLVFGEIVGALLEEAFDQAVEDESKPARRLRPALAWKSQPLPEGAREEAAVRLASGFFSEPRIACWFVSEPRDSQIRTLFYSGLAQSGQAGRALLGLTAALNERVAEAETWRLIARARLALGQSQEAIAALRASLSLDSRHPETWAVLSEMASAGGHFQIGEEIARLRSAL